MKVKGPSRECTFIQTMRKMGVFQLAVEDSSTTEHLGILCNCSTRIGLEQSFLTCETSAG